MAPRLTILLLFICAVCGAQSQKPLHFDVASVKPQKFALPATVGLNVEGNMLHAEHQKLSDLIIFAWNLKGFQLSGGPSWVGGGGLQDATLYEVLAKAAPGQTPTMDEFRLMLQSLLTERFQLKVHHENRQVPVYNLVVNKGGPKLKETAGGNPGIKQRNIGRVGMRLLATNVTMQDAVNGLLGIYASRPVLEKTGLTGHYDFTLEWLLDTTNADASAAGSDLPVYRTAVEEQLGLKLEPATAMFDTIVIDHAEKASEN